MDELRDKLYVLECAVEDVRRDLGGAPAKADYVDAVRWLIDAATPLFQGLDDPPRGDRTGAGPT